MYKRKITIPLKYHNQGYVEEVYCDQIVNILREAYSPIGYTVNYLYQRTGVLLAYRDVDLERITGITKRIKEILNSKGIAFKVEE